MFEWIATATVSVLIGAGIITYQTHRINTLKTQAASNVQMIQSLQQQRIDDQSSIDDALKQVRQAQNERNQMAQKLANIKDQQSLDWLHANIPDGVRSVLQGSGKTPAH